MLSTRLKLKLVGFACGILICFTIFGVLQEKIFRGRFGDEPQPDGKIGEKYKLPIMFGLMQSICYTLFAKALTLTHDHPKNETHQGFYFVIAVFYVLGKITAYVALQFVPYPVQVVGKASKPIPVMILGFLLGRKTYKLQKICFVLAIVAGVILFAFKDKYEEKDGENPMLGNSLIGASLLMDGLLGATEDRMRQAGKPSALNLMHFVNLWSCGVYTIGVLIFGEVPKFIDFTSKYPEIFKSFGLAVLVGALGQIFINSMISNFGPLPLSITTTTRKFFSVFLSVKIFENSLSMRQWCAAGIIFGVLFLDAALNKKMKTSTEKDNKSVEKNVETENHETKMEQLEVCDAAVTKV